MSPIQRYFLLRSVGFSHEQAEAFINRGILPAQNSEEKRRAIAQLRQKSQKQGVTV